MIFYANVSVRMRAQLITHKTGLVNSRAASLPHFGKAKSLWLMINFPPVHALNSSMVCDLMQKIHKFIEIALISLTLAACVILYTVGLDHADLGYERRWTYPIFFALIPAFCLKAGLRYLFKKKN